jgi:hypothetical protein
MSLLGNKLHFPIQHRTCEPFCVVLVCALLSCDMKTFRLTWSAQKKPHFVRRTSPFVIKSLLKKRVDSFVKKINFTITRSGGLWTLSSYKKNSLRSRKLRLTAVGIRWADYATPSARYSRHYYAGSCDSSVGIVRLRTKSHGVCFHGGFLSLRVINFLHSATIASYC